MDKTETIRIVDLHKKFDEKEVVKDLNLTLYSGQIFALLGHNGAGKTTTISMIIGLLEPTSGGINILNENDEGIRKKIGICPQHDTLYDILSV